MLRVGREGLAASCGIVSWYYDVAPRHDVVLYSSSGHAITVDCHVVAPCHICCMERHIHICYDAAKRQAGMCVDCLVTA